MLQTVRALKPAQMLQRPRLVLLGLSEPRRMVGPQLFEARFDGREQTGERILRLLDVDPRRRGATIVLQSPQGDLAALLALPRQADEVRADFGFVGIE